MGLPRVPRQPGPSLMASGPLFEAQYDNREGCPCGEELLEGDQVGYVDDELSCSDCWKKANDFGFTP